MNTRFWRHLYKKGEIESGGPYVTGWITTFFPYLKDRATGIATVRWKGIDKTGLYRLLDPNETEDGCEHSRCVGSLTTDLVQGHRIKIPRDSSCFR